MPRRRTSSSARPGRSAPDADRRLPQDLHDQGDRSRRSPRRARPWPSTCASATSRWIAATATCGTSWRRPRSSIPGSSPRPSSCARRRLPPGPELRQDGVDLGRHRALVRPQHLDGPDRHRRRALREALRRADAPAAGELIARDASAISYRGSARSSRNRSTASGMKLAALNAPGRASSKVVRR